MRGRPGTGAVVVVGLVTVLALGAVGVPLAAALEGTTLPSDPTTDPLEPLPSPTETDLLDPSESPLPSDDPTGTVDDTVGGVVAVVSPTSSPSPSPSPSASPSPTSSDIADGELDDPWVEPSTGTGSGTTTDTTSTTSSGSTSATTSTVTTSTSSARGGPAGAALTVTADPVERGHQVTPPRTITDADAPQLDGSEQPAVIERGRPDGHVLEDGGLIGVVSPVVLGDPVPARDLIPGPRSSVEIVDRLEKLGLSSQRIASILAPFPVAGPATYSNDWGAPRHTPTFHAHVGVDVFADRGTPVIASTDGVISNVRHGSAIGGNSLRVTASDGTFFYYAHLDAVAADIGNGVAVTAGQVLGTVGDTGNARGTPPHLHYEIHPGGGAPVPPVPFLDRWLADARATVEVLEGSATGAPQPLVAPPAVAAAPGAAGVAPGADAPDTAAAPTVPTGTHVAGRSATAPAASAVLAVLTMLGLYLMFRRPRPVSSTFLPLVDETVDEGPGLVRLGA